MWNALGKRLLLLFAVAGIVIGAEEILVILGIKERGPVKAGVFLNECLIDSGDSARCFSFGSMFDLAILLLSIGYLWVRPTSVRYGLILAAAFLYATEVGLVWAH
jgi:hypothetical protein